MDYFNLPASSRLTYRKLKESDIVRIIPFFENKDAIKFLPINADKSPLTRATLWVEKQIKRYDNQQYGLLALSDKNSNFIGMCGLLEQTIERRIEFEIGYHIMPSFWGNGYATEAAIHIKNKTFENTQIDSIISIIQPGNIASEKVAIKNGMTNLSVCNFHDLEMNIWRINKTSWINDSNHL